MKNPRSNAQRPWWRWLLNFALILCAFLLIQWWQSRPLANGQAPALAASLLNGQMVDLKHYRGQPLLVHFWAQWCPICRAEQGSIQAIAEDFPVLSIAMQSGSATTVAEFMREEDLTFPTIADPHAEIASAWGVKAVPVSFILDAAGTIRFSSVGYTTEAGLRARLWAAEKH
jgi:peroxiredoxin